MAPEVRDAAMERRRLADLQTEARRRKEERAEKTLTKFPRRVRDRALKWRDH